MNNISNITINNENVMMNYRNKGYTNAQIASACGISYGTVLKKIGAQPRSLTCRSQFIAACHRWNVDRAALRREVNICENEYKRIEKEYKETKTKLHFVHSEIETIAKMVKAVN